MNTAQRLMNLAEDLKAHWMPERNQHNGVKKTLAVLGIIGSTAAIGYGIYRAVVAHNDETPSLGG